MDDKERREISDSLSEDQKGYEKEGRPYLKSIESEEINRMIKHWNNIAMERGDSIEVLVQTLWEEMGREEGYKFTKEILPNGIRIRCTRCPLAKIARKHGLEHIGFHKYCMSDFGIVKGFNPRIKFTRTKTLMQGADCCDHTYTL